MKPGKGEQLVAEFTRQEKPGLDILVGARSCHDGKDDGNDGHSRGEYRDDQMEKIGQQGNDEKELFGKKVEQKPQGNLCHKGYQGGQQGQGEKLCIHEAGKVAFFFDKKEHQGQDPGHVLDVGHQHQKGGDQVDYQDHGVHRFAMGGMGTEAFFIFNHMIKDTDTRKFWSVDGDSGRIAPKIGADTIIAAGL